MIDCSGLAIVSRFPFKEVEFNAYTYRGDPAKMFIDGEWFSRKGAGRVQIEPLPNVTVKKISQNFISEWINNSINLLKFLLVLF